MYDDDLGWARVDALVTSAEAADLATRCDEVAAELTDPGVGDKPHGATKRLSALDTRLPGTLSLIQPLESLVDQILDRAWHVGEIAYRSPSPGTGGQKLHADDVPRLDTDSRYRCATAIIPLIDMTKDNGATRVVPGSHRRPDLQRRSQQVEHLPGETYLEGPAGTAFLFCGHLLHAGSENRSALPRPVLQVSYRVDGFSPLSA